MSPHPIANALSKNPPITSTSANISSQETLTNAEDIINTFDSLIDGVIDGIPGEQPPSSITDIITGKCYR
jgi:tRNA A37 threonylcarbamoyladenosine synthetase subunit TsaC/SUA5/YrdC